MFYAGLHLIAVRLSQLNVDITSVTDDRTVRDKPADVCAAILLIDRIDVAAGHKSSAKKAAALVTSRSARPRWR